MLYHGTLLYDYPLDLITAVLRTAAACYRSTAPDASTCVFVANLPTTATALRESHE